jgi:hypothetical protein
MTLSCQISTTIYPVPLQQHARDRSIGASDLSECALIGIACRPLNPWSAATMRAGEDRRPTQHQRGKFNPFPDLPLTSASTRASCSPGECYADRLSVTISRRCTRKTK